jgi:hypothetical protein
VGGGCCLLVFFIYLFIFVLGVSFSEIKYNINALDTTCTIQVNEMVKRIFKNHARTFSPRAVNPGTSEGKKGSVPPLLKGSGKLIIFFFSKGGVLKRKASFMLY